MKSQKRYLKGIALVIALMLIFALSACSAAPVQTTTSPSKDTAASPSTSVASSAAPASTTPAGTEKNNKHILFVPAEQTAYGMRAWDCAKKYAEKLGYTIELQGPSGMDPVAIVDTLTDCLSKDIDIVVTSSTDPVTLSTILNQWQSKDKTVVTWNLDCADPNSRDAYAGICDLNLLGDFIVDDMVKFMKTDDFEYAIVTSQLTSAFLTKRVERIQAYAKEKYPKLKCVAVEASEGDVQKALEVTQNILSMHPNIKAIIGNSQELDAPVSQAIIAANKVGKVYYFGHGTPNSAKPYFKQGVIGCISMWDPGQWGEWSIAVAAALYEGKDKDWKDGPIDYFKDFPNAEKVGNNLYYHDSFTFTKDNIDQFSW